MPQTQRVGGRPAPFVRTDNNGLFSSPGPYIGVIKNNIDPTCAGRLQVYIPQFGGPDQNDPGNWITVNYARPFGGQTRQRADLNWFVDSHVDFATTNGAIQENSFQSYGFWFVPPDLNGRVLCFFVNGDPSQGFWTHCVQDSMDSHMIPGIGAVSAANTNNPGGGGYVWQPTGANAIPSHTMLQSYIQISGGGSNEIPSRLPVSEPVIQNQSNSNPSTPSQVLMVPNVYQTLQLGLQGLAFDQIRGTTSASSVRENPSQVFGISTPGRLTSFANTTVSTAVLNQLTALLNSNQGQNTAAGQELTKALTCTYRTGGHQFVMDDGTIEGLDQGIRLRTTGGNEILMDDTNGQIYIINGPGTAWIELSPSGYIDVYSMKDFSIHTQGNFNVHADANISLNAGGTFKVHSDSGIQLDSGGKFTSRSTGGATVFDTASLSLGTGGPIHASGTEADFNTGSAFNVQAAAINLPGTATKVQDPGALLENKQIIVSKQPGTQAWWQTGTYKSIVSRAPAHEPWPGHEVNGIKTASVPQGDALGSPVVRPQSGTTSSGVRGTMKGPSINEADIASQPTTGAVCGLTVNETRALFAAFGKSESGWPSNSPGQGGTTQWVLSNGGSGYYAVNSLGFTGKYQFGAPALETYGFLKAGSSKNSTTANAIGNAANWTGFMGCNSAVDFMNSGAAQEALIMLMMKANCKLLTKWGILTPNTSHEDIAGYLGVCQLVGAGGALTYYRQQNPGSPLYNAPSSSFATSDAYGSSAQKYFTMASNSVQVADSSANA